MQVTKRGNSMRRLLYLATVSMVVMVVFATAAFAQTGSCADPAYAAAYPDICGTAAPAQTPAQPQTQAPVTQPLPSTGGPALLLPAAGLLLATALIGVRLARRS